MITLFLVIMALYGSQCAVRVTVGEPLYGSGLAGVGGGGGAVDKFVE